MVVATAEHLLLDTWKPNLPGRLSVADVLPSRLSLQGAQVHETAAELH